jgi:hypothetical protein
MSESRGAAMPSVSSWRDLLKEVISDPNEKERIAREMSVN